GDGAQSDRPHGQAGGNGPCGRVPGEPGGELHYWDQSCGRWRVDPRRAVLARRIGYKASPRPVPGETWQAVQDHEIRIPRTRPSGACPNEAYVGVGPM